MNWHRISPDTLRSDEGYLITRCQVDGRSHYAAWHDGHEIAHGWHESAEPIKAQCDEHREGRG